MNIQEFLGRHDVPFEVMAHEATYDAQHLAQAVHTSGHHVAKTVLLRTDNENYVVAVLAATHSIDFEKVKAALNAMNLFTFYGGIQFDTTEGAHGMQIAHKMVVAQWQKNEAGELVRVIIAPPDVATAAPLYPIPTP